MYVMHVNGEVCTRVCEYVGSILMSRVCGHMPGTPRPKACNGDFWAHGPASPEPTPVSRPGHLCPPPLHLRCLGFPAHVHPGPSLGGHRCPGQGWASTLRAPRWLCWGLGAAIYTEDGGHFGKTCRQRRPHYRVGQPSSGEGVANSCGHIGEPHRPIGCLHKGGFSPHPPGRRVHPNSEGAGR